MSIKKLPDDLAPHRKVTVAHAAELISVSEATFRRRHADLIPTSQPQAPSGRPARRARDRETNRRLKCKCRPCVNTTGFLFHGSGADGANPVKLWKRQSPGVKFDP